MHLCYAIMSPECQALMAPNLQHITMSAERYHEEDSAIQAQV